MFWHNVEGLVVLILKGVMQTTTYYNKYIIGLALFPLTDMQTPPLKSIPSQKVIMNGAECLNRTGKIIKKFSDFYFSSPHQKME